MVVSRVLILYEPQLYSDLICDLIEQLGLVDVIEIKTKNGSSANLLPEEKEDIDVVLLPLDNKGEPKVSLLPDLMPMAKLVAFSPDGSFGMRRLPGENTWAELRPFGLLQLVVEVLQANPAY